MPPGVMSTYLREKAVPGTPVEFIDPAGSFYLREIKRPLLLLAGGTGLAPFLSMLGKITESGSSYPIHLGNAHPRKGCVTAHVEANHLNGGDLDVYLCGPPPMVDAVRAGPGEQSVTPVNFYYEKFSPSGAATPIGEAQGRRRGAKLP